MHSLRCADKLAEIKTCSSNLCASKVSYEYYINENLKLWASVDFPKSATAPFLGLPFITPFN